MNRLINLIPGELVNALGWTLLHALWQGAFVALILSILLVLLHRRSAKTRYAVASAAMLAQLVLSAFTLSYYANVPVSTAKAFPAEVPGFTVEATAAAASFWADPVGVSQVYFEQHLPLLVLLWLLGMVLMAVRLMGGLAYTQRLRHYRTTALGERWQQQLDLLRRRLGVSQAVQLMESALVRVPMAIGVAKPVILLPVGAVAGLTQAQVEAVLAHELAHIFRKDYLLNLLQSVVDMLFFFHPAMWWVSGVVRAERENCCDDIAVALCGDKLTYARALTELETMRMPGASGAALAFSGQRGSLVNRIKRLVGQPLKPTFTEGFAAGLVLVVGVLVLSFGAVAGQQPLEGTVLEPLEEGSTAADTKADSEEAVAFMAQDSAGKNRNVVIITNKKGKVKQLYVDGKRIPKRDIDKYKSLVDQRLEATKNAPKASRDEVKALIEREQRALDRVERQVREERTVVQSFRGDRLPPLPPMPPVPPVPPVGAPALPPPPPPAPPAGASKKNKKAFQQLEQLEQLEQYEQQVEQYEQELEQYEQQVEQAVSALEQEAAVKRIAQDSLRQKEMKLRQEERATAMRARMEARQEEMQARRAEMEARREEMEARRRDHAKHMDEMKAEMVKDGLIDSNSSNLNIRINNGELFINDKKQPKKVYDKYKKWMAPDSK